MSSKKYFQRIDILRIVLCIAILLYHLNILKGGYLAVCCFFTLSSFLACISAFNKDKFSLLDYYKNRIKKIYIPLIIVTFSTVLFVSILPDNSWFNFKREVTSVLFGYNNFWQLSANLDYFARHINSPFMHFWYIGILLQFELLFPIIFVCLKKIGEKTKKYIPSLLLGVLSLVSIIYFYYMSLNHDIMFIYYNTFTRCFSLLIGLFGGFLYANSNKKSIVKSNLLKNIITSLYLIILVLSFIFIDVNSNLFSVSMILVSIFTWRFIVNAMNLDNCKNSIFENVIKFFANISYEIYLIQYPLIYIMQGLNISKFIYYLALVVSIIGISHLIHFSLDKKNNSKLKYATLLLFTITTILGGYKYITAKDYTEEMNQLKKQLAKNEELIKEKRKQYEEALKKENDEWANIMNSFLNSEKELENVILNLPIVGVGDSVMLGAVNDLYEKFPNSYFDAQISRTAWVVNGILVELKNNGQLGYPIILNLGTNGDCNLSCKREIIATCGDRDIFWINVTNDKDVHINATLNELAKDYDNLYIIDWNGISSGHDDYFVADKIHLTPNGRKAYVKAIYDSIYKVYLDKLNAEKQEILNNREEELKNKLSFYGNDILLNSFDYIENNFSKAKFIINKDFKYNLLYNDLSNSIKNEGLTHKIVFMFDSSIEITKDEYTKIFDLLNTNEIYVVAVSEKDYKLLQESKKDNVEIIDFYKEINDNPSYLMADGIHLTETGNKALGDYLNNYFNK